MKIKSKKYVILSVVALILVTLMTVGVTYSWIDDLKLVEFKNDDVSDNKAPLKAGVDINSDVIITNENTEIDLGNVLYADKENIMYSEGDSYHVRYDTDGADSSKEPEWDTTIKNKKGYFYESGDMHLSGCYGDGENFFFPLGSSNGFREGNKDDENVNYISMTMKVSSPNANVDFWFREVPTVKVHSAEDPTGENSPIIPQARYAISVDGDMHVYSSTGTALTKSATNVSTTAVPGVRKTSAYTFNDKDNESSIRGKNGNTLFSIKKGDTVTLNVKIWLESGFSSDNIQNVDVRMAIVSSYAYDRVITIVDKTMGPQGTSWLDDDHAKLYLTLPAVLDNLSTSKSEWSNLGNNGAPFFELQLKTKENEDDPDEYEATVPMIYNNEEMILYRCNDKGWNDNLSNAKKRSPYLVHCWNWWRSFLPDSFQPETYTLYGCSLDKSAYDVFGDEIPPAPEEEASDSEFRTNQGYGTWGGVELITISERFNDVEYAPKNKDNTDYKLFVRDYSDHSSTGITYTYEMYYNSYNWYSYVPKSSALLQFAYYNSSNQLKGKWGYDSWQAQCPQQRPLKGDIYNNNSLTYQMTQNHSGGDKMDQGRGYWSGADKVYLIKSGNNWSTSVPHAFMKDDNTNSKNPAMTQLNGIKYAGTTDVYISSQSHINGTTVYWDVYFNNGANDDSSVNPNSSWTVNSDQKYLFPGCFYDFANNRWLGSLRGSGRDAATVETDTGGGGGGGSSETNTDSMDGYSNSTNFTFQVNYNNNTKTYDVQSSSSSDSGSSTFKVDIELRSGVNWITVQKSGTNFGLQKSGQIFTVGSNMGLYITNASGQQNNFGFRAADAGHYIAYFQYDNGNMNTLKIASVLKKAVS